MITATDRIAAEVERIVASAGFSNSPRLVALLRFCVEQSRLGKFENLKESTIGVAVFGRDADYNPKTDPIVRVTATRLREKLDAYYRAQGANPAIQIPKGGYVAWFAEVELAKPPAVSPAMGFAAIVTPSAAPAATPGSISVHRPQARFLFPGIFLSIAVLVLAIAWPALRSAFGHAAAEPLAILPGAANDPAWSPDGSRLAFAWDGGGGRPVHVYSMERGGSVPVRITQDDRREYRPVWSPDGRQIALLRGTEAGQLSLVVVDLARKTERVVHSIAQPQSLVYLTALDWSPDGNWLVTSETPAGGGSRHLILVSIRDGSFHAITDPPLAATGDVEARFSPDGREIAFRRGSEGTLFLLSLATGGDWQPAQLTRINSGVRGIAWSADGNRIYFGSQQDQGYFGIWSISRAGGSPSRLTGPGVQGMSPSLNKAHGLLAFSQPQVSQNLWLYPLEKAHEPRIVVPSTSVQSSAAFSPDGKRFAFVSSRSGKLEVWVSEVEDGTPRKLTSLGDATMIWDTSWSPDGASVLYSARRKGENAAIETKLATGSTSVLRQSVTYSSSPQYSADGPSLFFSSNAGQTFGIWRQLVGRPATAEMAIPGVSGSFRMARDRRSLFFIRNGKLIQHNLDNKEESEAYVFPPTRNELRAWDVADSALFYVEFDSRQSVANLVCVHLPEGNSQVFGSFRVQSTGHWPSAISAAPDGSSVIVSQTDRDDAKMMSIPAN